MSPFYVFIQNMHNPAKFKAMCLDASQPFPTMSLWQPASWWSPSKNQNQAELWWTESPLQWKNSIKSSFSSMLVAQTQKLHTYLCEEAAESSS